MEGEIASDSNKMIIDEPISDHPKVETSSPIVPMEEDFSESSLIDPPTVVSWGRTDLGCLLRKKDVECQDGMCSYHSEVKSFVSVSSNGYHTAAVTATGELYTCGQNDEGQVSDNHSDVIDRPQVLESLGNHRIVSVACGLNHTICVTASGCAISFGSNESGQLGHTPEKLSKVPPRVVNFSFPPRRTAMIVTKVACGDLFSLFLTTAGEVFGCGSASFLGNTINPQKLIVHQAERIETLVGSNVIDIAAGSSHGLALTTSGELYGWGSNRHCELGIEQSMDVKGDRGGGEDHHQQTPLQIPLPDNVGQIVGISAGYSHSIFWTNRGSLWGAGFNKHGQLGLPYPRVDRFEHIPLPFFCVMASCGFNHTIVLCNAQAAVDRVEETVENKSDLSLGPPLIRINSYNANNTNMESSGVSHVFAFGSNAFGQVCSTSPANIFRSPVEVDELSAIAKLSKVLYVSAGGDQSFAIGVRDSKNSLESRFLLRKQFSSVASKAVVAMSTQSLLNLIKKCGDNGEEDQKMVAITLSTVCEIFSSPSLIAGSFQDDSVSLTSHVPAIDVEGVEAVYVGLLQLGSHAVARLVGAIQQTITELERAVASAGAALPESSVRVFLILWQSPIMSNTMMSSDLFLRMMKMTHFHSHAIVETIARSYPSHIFASRLLKPLQEHISYYVSTESSVLSSMAIETLCLAASWLHEVNRRQSFVPAEVFYSTSLSDLPEQILIKDYITWRQARPQTNSSTSSSQSDPKHSASTASSATANSASNPQNPSQSHSSSTGTSNTASSALKRGPFFLCDYPFLLSAIAKRKILLAEAMLQQQAAQNQSITQGLLSGANVIFPWFVLPIERDHLLQQTLLHIAHASTLDLKKPMKVIFIGEEGIDEGGVRKEFFQLLTAQLFNLEFGMFVPVADGRSIWLNKDNSWSKDEYQLVGSLLGLALYNGVLLDVHLPHVLYKKLLQQPLTLPDLSSIDAGLCDGLQKLLQFEPAEAVESVFCRTFSVEWEEFGAMRSFDLIPDGSNIAVTGDNRSLYVEKMIQWLLTDSIQEQFQALFDGFTRVISPNQLLLVTPDELELLMVGTPHLDFKELESTTEYIGETNWNATNPTIQWFWEVLHQELSLEEKQKFLLFVTGSHKAPIGGLKNIGLKIQRMGPDTNSLPTSHTCFNVLLLPEYSSKEKLSERLKKAIMECEGFGLK